MNLNETAQTNAKPARSAKTARYEMVLTGVSAALVFVFTAFLHIPSHTGYTHVGDAFVFLAACLLPAPNAALAGGIGAVLADGLTGYAIWAPGSAVIKAVTALFFTRRSEKVLTLRNLLALLPAGVICIGGYYLYDAVITGNFIAPAAGIPGYVTQWVLSSALFLAVGFAFDRLRLKERFGLLYEGKKQK